MIKVLHTIYSMNPQIGGTVEAVNQLVSSANQEDQQHDVLTLDDPDLLTIFNHPISICAVGPTKRFYGDTPKLDRWLENHLEEYDIAIIHGCWQYHGLATFRACKKQGIPYLQYTHGMLDPWFKKHYPLKHLKKWLYWPWAEYRILKNATKVIFTCKEEQRLSATSFWLYKVNPTIISLGISKPKWDKNECENSFLKSYPDLKNKRLITFMSRIHEKKGVDQLIDSALRFQKDKSDEDPQVTLVVAGPIQDNSFAKQLKEKSKQLSKTGPIESIVWIGMVQNKTKWGLLSYSEAFILPSHQENFGLVVAEALSSTTPVLISNKVNIWKEIASSHAGLIENDTDEGTYELLAKWIAMEASEQDKYKTNALAAYKKNFEIGRNAEIFFRLIKETVQNTDETYTTEPI